MSNVRPAAIPIIETERTILRDYRLSDFDADAAMWADAAVTRFTASRQPLTREDAWARYLRYAGLWAVLGYGFWAVEEKSTGRLIGNAGFHDLRRDIEPSIEGVPEAGWILIPEVYGRGLATEIVSAMHCWGDACLGGGRTVCIIDPDNSASLRVAAKCGYRERVRTRYHDKPTILFERQAGTKTA